MARPQDQLALKAGERIGLVDPVWRQVRGEAEQAMRAEPALATFLLETIVQQPSLEDAIIHRIAARLDHPDVHAGLIRQAFLEALGDDASIAEAFRADIMAVYDRDPACERMLEPILYFKGFQALQTHRLAHWLIRKGRRDFALYLQSRSSGVFQTDINPAAKIGRAFSLITRPALWLARRRRSAMTSRSCRTSLLAAPARNRATGIRRSETAC